MTSSELLSSPPNQAVIRHSGAVRKRPTSYDDVLNKINDENVYVDSSAAAAAANTASNEKRCLCAPTTHVGSFRCRLHRGLQKQWACNMNSSNTGSRSSSSQMSAPSVRSVPFKLLAGEKNGRRSLASIGSKNAVRTGQTKPASRLNKVVTGSQDDSNSKPVAAVDQGVNASSKMDG